MFPTLTDEQRRFVSTVRELAQSEFRERAQRYMDGTFPWENMKALAELGVLGMAVPEEYGGLGLPVFDTALVLEEIAKTCYVTAMAVLGEVGVQTRIISHYAPEAIKRRILPAVCSGECLLAICMTEPDAGTDVTSYKTNVDRVGNRLRLNGVKTLISRAEEAGMFVVFTRIDKKPGREGIGCVLVEKGTPGFSVTGTYHTMGGENLHEIRFEDVELPPENLVLEDGFRQLLNAFNTQRCLNPSISLGLAEGALEEAVKEWPRERVPLDWAMTQNNLGSALTRLGERESGAAQLEEAVAAFDAALEVFEAAPADHYIGICRRNRASAAALLEERRKQSA